MKVKPNTVTVKRESTSDEYPEAELPDDAQIVGMYIIGGRWCVIQYVTFTLRPSRSPL